MLEDPEVKEPIDQPGGGGDDLPPVEGDDDTQGGAPTPGVDDGELGTPRQDRYQKRIVKITAEKYEAIRDAAYWKGVAEARRQEEAEKAGKPPVQEPAVPAYQAPPFGEPRPNSEAFETWEQYEIAKDEWLIKRAQHEAYHRAKAEIAADQAKQKQEAEVRGFQDWRQQGAVKFEDFETVALSPALDGPNAALLGAMVRADDISHDIAYYLGKNPQEFRRLSAMEPIKMALEVGKLSVKLATKGVKPEPSKTPAPIKPITPAPAKL